MYSIHSIPTNMFRVILVLLQHYKVTIVLLYCHHSITIKIIIFQLKIHK